MCCFPIGRPADIELICPPLHSVPEPLRPSPYLYAEEAALARTHTGPLSSLSFGRSSRKKPRSLGPVAPPPTSSSAEAAANQPIKFKELLQTAPLPSTSHPTNTHAPACRDNSLPSQICHLRRAPIIMYEASAQFRRGGI